MHRDVPALDPGGDAGRAFAGVCGKNFAPRGGGEAALFQVDGVGGARGAAQLAGGGGRPRPRPQQDPGEGLPGRVPSKSLTWELPAGLPASPGQGYARVEAGVGGASSPESLGLG